MRSQKRQDFPPGLYVVATPIGTLSDLGERARAVLSQSRAILCEDTRVTRRLLSAFEISAPELVRMDANEESSDHLKALAERVAGWINEGGVICLVSDAGTPGVSDPGGRMVQSMRERGVSIWSVPGPSSLSSFLSVAGFWPPPLHFWAFAPRESSERSSWLREARLQPGFHVFFEAPSRLEACLGSLRDELDSDAHVVLGKELSKQFERVVRLSVSELMPWFEALPLEERKGEWVLGFIQNKDNNSNSKQVLTEGDVAWRKALELLINAGISASIAAKQVSQMYDVKHREAYEHSLLLKNKK